MRFAKTVSTRLGTAARVLLAQIRGFGTEGDDDNAEKADDVEVMQPLGLFTRPSVRASLEAVIVEIGETLIAFGLHDKGAGSLGTVEEGETRLYGAKESTCRVRLRADGSLDIEAKSAANIRITTAGGGNVVLNGGTLKVARDTDPVSASTAMATWMAAVVTKLNILAPVPATTAGPAGIGVIDGGNTTVKA